MLAQVPSQFHDSRYGFGLIPNQWDTCLHESGVFNRIRSDSVRPVVCPVVEFDNPLNFHVPVANNEVHEFAADSVELSSPLAASLDVDDCGHCDLGQDHLIRESVLQVVKKLHFGFGQDRLGKVGRIVGAPCIPVFHFLHKENNDCEKDCVQNQSTHFEYTDNDKSIILFS